VPRAWWAVLGGFLALAIRTDLVGQRVDVAGRHCDLQRPSELPPLATVFDAAAGFGALAALSPEIGGQAVISVSFGPDGAAGEARVLATDLPDSTARVVLTTVAGALRDLHDPGLPGLRLRVTVGGPPAVRLEVASYCEPEPGPGARGVERVTVYSTSPPPSVIHPPRIRFLVRADGSVEDVRVEVGSGQDELDRSVVERTRQQRFKPALLDGIPISVWLHRP
jgi:TonB family protein